MNCTDFNNNYITKSKPTSWETIATKRREGDFFRGHDRNGGRRDDLGFAGDEFFRRDVMPYEDDDHQRRDGIFEDDGFGRRDGQRQADGDHLHRRGIFEDRDDAAVDVQNPGRWPQTTGSGAGQTSAGGRFLVLGSGGQQPAAVGQRTGAGLRCFGYGKVGHR
ncbi:voltage-dependent P/Q-type calcium channel subunit alpha-1A [Striga asiatica]|uniref:Voltage-dependent P/Q-type calcium channel subunit alpha-1A n=1 Tax=Striga asiatica TaxID=4170 RepID=A0A5A7R1P8_STRAF|nr:voltage-dependent P/Q-type calcium channel subunit alpha-1A [Striga asiatica]